MARAGKGGRRSVSVTQVVVVIVGVSATLLGLLFVLGITIGAVSGFPATATLLIPALIFLALSVLLLGSALGLRRFGPTGWWVATILSGLMLLNVGVVIVITGSFPLGILLLALASGAAFIYLLFSREAVLEGEGGAPEP